MGIHVGIDLMGGDHPPQMIFDAVLQVSQELDENDKLIVLAKHAVYPELKRSFSSLISNGPIEFITTDEAIEMDDAPLLAVRRKKKSSMAIGLKLLNENKLDAFVSMGNTGALVASSLLYIPTFPHIDRPALLVVLPTDIAVLDVGANISVKPMHFFSNALLGSIYQQIVKKISSPKVGLLNIGVEEQKGTKELKETYQLFQKYFGENFLGNIEGREVYQNKIDVLVTDGFTGNVFLKTSEGVSGYLMEYIKNNFQGCEHVVSHLHQRFNYSEHPGAILLGMDKLVVKCHGHSDAVALMNGIRGAIDLAKRKIVQKIKEQLHQESNKIFGNML